MQRQSRVATLTWRVPQTPQHVEPLAVNATCHGEGRLAEPDLTNQGVPSQSSWNTVFKERRQQVQTLELCAAS